jgi:hypothetical protein
MHCVGIYLDGLVKITKALRISVLQVKIITGTLLYTLQEC